MAPHSKFKLARLKNLSGLGRETTGGLRRTLGAITPQKRKEYKSTTTLDIDADSLHAYPLFAPRSADLLDDDHDSTIHKASSCPQTNSLAANSTIKEDCNSEWPLDDDGILPSSVDVPSPDDAPGRQREAPTLVEAQSALKDINKVLRPPRKKGPGYLDPKLDPFTQTCIKGMQSFLVLYTSPNSPTYGNWSAASQTAAITMCRGNYCARVLRRMARQYISDRSLLPENPYGNWNETLLELNLYLQELGSQVTAAKVQEWLHRRRFTSFVQSTTLFLLNLAKRYLRVMGFHGHGHQKRADVVWEREKVFIPRVKQCNGKRVVLWFHDESIFYAHDRRRHAWYHKDGPIKPYKKGEGVSLMIADLSP
ncbi:hypothetical protein K435DRAFT_823274 [Dendrothele bispora CBS 962.96]|uniref:Uncharacterized protein n=1 Tax=Dendrothele bispora (strain CBS 962.96) TaxID=1314807 RepID=A0A4S8L2M6_DENBC|nr:hypothetical protein K435DRAFT_823274 [Dendrothele bispora CBS 962.96]